MEQEYFRKISITIIFVILLVLSYFLIKPLLIPIILGIILAFIFLPLYKFTYKHLKLKDLSAFIICVLLLLLIIIPIWYLTPIIFDQTFEFFVKSQQIDIGGIIQKIFPSISENETLSNEIVSTARSFISNSTTQVLRAISDFILNLPTIFLQIVVVLFTFFFVLRDNEKLSSYVRSLIPFPKNIQDRLFKSSREITISVVYGRIALGIAQGIIVGIGFFVLGVENALLLTVLSALAGILPIIGTIIVWLPVSIFLFASGDNIVALGIIGFGILATIFESVIQPVLLARMVKMNSSVMLIGMIGGLFMFGILGVILGPLILAYLLIILEIYRDKRIPGVLIEEAPKDDK